MGIKRIQGQLSNTNTNIAVQVIETDGDAVSMEVADNEVVAKDAAANVDVTLPDNPFYGEEHLLVNSNSLSLTLKGGLHTLWDRGIAGDVIIGKNSSLKVTFSTSDTWITECCADEAADCCCDTFKDLVEDPASTTNKQDWETFLTVSPSLKTGKKIKIWVSLSATLTSSEGGGGTGLYRVTVNGVELAQAGTSVDGLSGNSFVLESVELTGGTNTINVDWKIADNAVKLEIDPLHPGMHGSLLVEGCELLVQ